MRTTYRGVEMHQSALDCLIEINNAGGHTGPDCGQLSSEQTVYCPYADITHTTDNGCAIQYLLNNGWTETQNGGGNGGGENGNGNGGSTGGIDNQTLLLAGGAVVLVAVLWFMSQ